MNLFIAIILLSLTSLFVVSLLKLRSKPAYCLGIFIAGYATIVLISELASLLRQITPAFFLATHLIALLIAWVVWHRMGKPSLLGPFSDGRWAIWRTFPRFREHPGLYLLAFGVLAVYLFGAGLIIALPQHNYDGMTYHLSRVGYWLQHQSLSPWPTPNPRQTTSPINAELGLMWLVMFWGTDQLTGFVQWFAALGIGVAIYGLARLMGASRSQGVFASLVWGTFPQILLQSTTTQNDLVTTFFFITMLYFFFRGLQRSNVQPLILSGIALGLAVGTKATILFALPGLAVAIIVIALIQGKPVLTKLIVWAIFCGVGMIFFGAYTYLQNQVYYGDPLSVPEWTSRVAGSGSGGSRLPQAVTTLIVYFSQFLDFTGLPETLTKPLYDLISRVLEWILFKSGLQISISRFFSPSLIARPLRIVHEDTTWFGPLSFLLLLPASIIGLFRGIGQKDSMRVTLGIISLGFLILVSYFLGWSPYRGRYFVLSISLLAPFLYILYHPDNGKRLVYVLVSLVAIWIMGFVTLHNAGKPLIGENSVWGKSSIEIRMSNNPKMVPVVKMVDKHVPQDAVLGTRLGVDHWDYVLFGERFGRTVIPLDPTYPGIDQEFITTNGVEYLLVAPRERPFLEVPPNLMWEDDVSSWYLFSTSAGESLPPSKYVSDKLLGLTDEKRLIQLDETLAGVVGVTELYAVDWDVETNNSEGFKWIGEGLEQGLRCFLWSEKQIPVNIVFSLQPGPSREDAARNLEIGAFRYGAYGPITDGAVIESLQINQEQIYEIVVELQKGLTEVRIYSLDRATIPVLPNGDTRPLLVRLGKIQVEPFQNNSEILVVDSSLTGDLQVRDLQLAPWGFERFEGETFLWLGEGEEQGYRSYLWSQEEMGVRLIMTLEPGPSRGDRLRNLQFTLSQQSLFEDAQPKKKTITISGPIQYSLVVNLHAGLNEMELFAVDEATIEVLPGGDVRPLLVKLSEIVITPLDE